MDRDGIERGMIAVDFGNETAKRALREHPDRLFASYEVDPNRGMDEVRKLVALRETFGIKAATASPALLLPQVPIDDRRFYPIYAKCVELDLPICVSCGVPRECVPMACQDVARVDEVCWFFPELRLVMRDGAEPWCDLATALLSKWPNLYYTTSGLAPREYPRAIVDFANTRGADKVLYGGGTFAELSRVPFRDHVWPKFLRENARRVFRL
jgi:predicted TIM-barrel fold metal-dependent hydrolase